MSEDPKQEFLCDGITEEIITALSKVPRLLVIARTSTGTYKGKPVKVKQVSEELGVQYVLEGGLQRSGDRLRVTVQLIDALTGNHLWAERYDKDLKDIFALEDEITVNILTNVRVKLTLDRGDVSTAVRMAQKYYKGKQGLDCYLKLMEADYCNWRWNIEDNNVARGLIEEVIALCPENPMDYLVLGWVDQHAYVLGNTKSPRETIEKSIALAQKALAMDDSIADGHALLSTLYATLRDFDKGVAEGERAVALNPNGVVSLVGYAFILTAAGRPEEAIPLFQRAIRISPLSSSNSYLQFGNTFRNMGRYEEAVSTYRKAIQITPNNIFSHLGLAASYSLMGREKDSRAEADEVLRINPKFSLDQYGKILLYYKDQSISVRIVAALRKAGLK